MIHQETVAEFDGKAVRQYTMKNKSDMEISVLNYGAVVTRIMYADKNGYIDNRVLRYADVALYEENPMFFGAAIGRVAGRIKGGTFDLDSKTYRLEKNEGENHLHGGTSGFHHCIWSVEPIEKAHKDILEFTLCSASHEDYPGNLVITMRYILDDCDTWKILYHIQTDAPTICNMTNHTYFNLAGAQRNGTVSAHELGLGSAQAVEIDAETLPTARLIERSDPVFDFSCPRAIGQYFGSGHPQITLAHGGYDHAFLLDKRTQQDVLLYEKQCGIELRMRTTEEAVVVYTCNKITQPYPLEGGSLKKHGAVTLETQALPDRIHTNDPSRVLVMPGTPYKSWTTYTFSRKV